MTPGSVRSALLVHGAGSAPGFVQQLGQAGGLATRSWWLPGHGGRHAGTDAVALAELDRLVAALRPEIVGGVSYGAQLSARWAAARRPPGHVEALLLLLPAWGTGNDADPTGPAALSAAGADEVERLGLVGAAARVTATAPGWVGEAVASAYRQHRRPAVVTALRRLAASPGPTAAELAQLRLPAAVVAHTGDRLHPVVEAQRWAAAIPRSTLRVVTVRQLADLGHAAADALRELAD